MLSHYSHVDNFGDGPTGLMSLGPSPAPGLSAPLRSHVRNPKPRHNITPTYLCPVPIKSSSPLPSASSRRKNRPVTQDKSQRQASEEISHILSRPNESLRVSEREQHLLDGSRSADMFVGKRYMGSHGVLHFATPPVGAIDEEGEFSDSDDRVMHSGPREESTDFLSLHELRQVMSSPSHPPYIRSASVQDLAVMVDSFTPPDRSQNPLPRSFPFASSESANYEGAEIGLLSFSPPTSLLDEDIKARRAQYARAANLNSDFRNRQRFGDASARYERTY